jgi:competence CoiA-like predicted nuclease
MPLRAMDDGQEFFAWDLSEQHRAIHFTCPICEDQLIPVLPQENIINHFRHKNEEAHGEPETPEHLAMKQQLKDILGSDCEIEVRIGDNIVDALYKKRPRGARAIECQCSDISTAEFQARNDNYWKNGCRPFWILGGVFFSRTRTFIQHPRGYGIQRIKKIEMMIKRTQPLLYYGEDKFWESDLNLRFHAKTLGWYNLHPYYNLQEHL